MEKIKVLKNFGGFYEGDEVTVTSATATRKVSEGYAEFIAKEAKEEFETKEEKRVKDNERKISDVKKGVTKAPGQEPVKRKVTKSVK